MINVLMILTSATVWTQKDGSQRPSGFWAEEFIAPHQHFSGAGARITIATPGGLPAVVDALSLSPEANHGDTAKVEGFARYLEGCAQALRAPLRIEDVAVADYDIVFVPGGHGPMQDLAVNASVGQVLTTALAAPFKVVAAVCHGQAAFLAAGDAQGWAFKGRRMTAFTNDEETQVGLAANAPWLLETRLRDAGASFEQGGAWQPHVVVDGNLVTGQNPFAAGAVAQEAMAMASRISA
ncbi:type 1 glutamine amidotransferase domain-containing protein [Roseateles sp. L2-2]|uniref:type 1 glutamine amidotransferase domain-containing protein n=1 Tax=Roseateles sp. L2-2 TaxID=3422597 RepID=UPI003D35A07E